MVGGNGACLKRSLCCVSRRLEFRLQAAPALGRLKTEHQTAAFKQALKGRSIAVAKNAFSEFIFVEDYRNIRSCSGSYSF